MQRTRAHAAPPATVECTTAREGDQPLASEGGRGYACKLHLANREVPDGSCDISYSWTHVRMQMEHRAQTDGTIQMVAAGDAVQTAAARISPLNLSLRVLAV